jgi:hypothetical protein
MLVTDMLIQMAMKVEISLKLNLKLSVDRAESYGVVGLTKSAKNH